MTEPLRLRFEVACDAAHAFETWTAKIATWWPADHTVSGAPLDIRMEPGVGGRIVERVADGTEIDWGEVVEWDPPRSVAYLWHLGGARDVATDVEVRFSERGDGGTTVEIVHSGWERLGEAAAERRDRNVAGWTGVTAHYRRTADARHP